MQGIDEVVKCPTHGRELQATSWSRASWNGWRPIPDLRCPEPGCEGSCGEICTECHLEALVRTRSRPDLDREDRHWPPWAWYSCPRCNHVIFYVGERRAAGGV